MLRAKERDDVDIAIVEHQIDDMAKRAIDGCGIADEPDVATA
jgi:hypothetical protein